MSETPISSNVTVDPGSIADFAQFLSDMHQEIAALEDTLAHYADEHAVVNFGAFPNSRSAYQRHLTAVRAARDNTKTLVARTAELVQGTEELAKQYTNLNALNASGATTVITTLNQPVKEA